jgi:tetratricopeptide (TPR) repeat protein
MLEVTPEFRNTHLFRLWTLIALERYEESLAAADRAHLLYPDPEGSAMGPLAMKGYALARMGRRHEAEALIEQIRAQGSSPAILLHALGRDDEALALLRAAVAERSVSVTFLGADLRDLPAFQAVLSSGNLLDVSNRIRR